MSDGWECVHCGEYKDEGDYDNGALVCRACEARRKIRSMTREIEAHESSDKGGDA